MESRLLARMENDPRADRSPSGAQAQQILRGLHSDRAALAERLAAPWWFHAISALIATGFMATPAIRSDDARTMVVVGLLMADAIALPICYQRVCGVRIGRVGPRCGALLVGLVAVTVLLLCTSYGLASSLNLWWVLAPAAACFVVVLIGGRWFDRMYREDLRRGH